MIEALLTREQNTMSYGIFIPRQLPYLGLLLLLMMIAINVKVIYDQSTESITLQELSKFYVRRDEIVRNTQAALPHLPIRVWEGDDCSKWYYKNQSCARFPAMADLQVYDQYWQSLHTPNHQFHLFGAYYDARKRCSDNSSVRILGMINNNSAPSDKLYCQIWFPYKQEPVIVQTSKYENVMSCYWDNCDNFLYTYLITCSIPKQFRKQKPSYISLVERKCDIATNILTINYNMLNRNEQKDQFAVCVKMLDFLHVDISARAIEWIELLRLLGANKIFFYTLHAHENIIKVFEYYKEQGIVEVVPITLGGYQPNMVGLQHLYLYSDMRNYFQRTLHELISLNDCFYKNMYRYKYISSLDLDEVIIPQRNMNWGELMNKLSKQPKSRDKKPVASYLILPTIFSPKCDNSTKWNTNIPDYMYMLQHVLHYDFKQKLSNTKVFFDTEIVEAVFNHFASKCLNAPNCRKFWVNRKDARVFHYRDADFNRSVTCDQMKNDTSLWRYKDRLIDRTSTALSELGFLSS